MLADVVGQSADAGLSPTGSGAGSEDSRTGTAFLRAQRGSARLDRGAVVARKRGSSLRIPVDVIDTVEVDGGLVRIRLLAESDAETRDLCVFRHVSGAEARNFVAEVAAAIPVDDRVARLGAIADRVDDLHITRCRHPRAGGYFEGGRSAGPASPSGRTSGTSTTR